MQFVINTLWLIVRTWFVMLMVGAIHINYEPRLPAYGFDAVLAFTVLFGLLTDSRIDLDE